ncbi:alpha-2-macroglobulin-like protein [Plakobranchus ocellatus]|uniref:Alpha-2-macroglobulin-like protein n=1 Tax=Plakobranchus ocellatus TaxID=259542 RepID=A0AAV4BDG3_9GAST|nr:alpha-2-macroglobulin-like protein [Plakobranchus ocellatus]
MTLQHLNTAVLLSSPNGEIVITETTPKRANRLLAKALCVSERKGFGMSKVATLTTFKPISVKLSHPNSVVIDELLQVQVILSSNLENCLKVRLTVNLDNKLATLRTGHFRHPICVCPWNTTSFFIRTYAIGVMTIKAIATIVDEKCYAISDIDFNLGYIGMFDTDHSKMLIKAQGVELSYTYASYLCPKDGKPILEEVPLELPKGNEIVRHSAHGEVQVIGDMMGAALNNLDYLVRMPTGCGEQHMVGFVSNIVVLNYLSNTGNMKEPTRQAALNNLEIGYQRAVKYRHKDGSFSAFGKKDPKGSVWLTAYVVKSFAQAQKHIFIDADDLKNSVDFLVRSQLETGCFREAGMVSSSYMMGGLGQEQWQKPEGTLTAFVLLALMEAGIDSTNPNINLGIKCMNRELDARRISLDPYTLALVTLANMKYNAHSADATLAFKILQKMARKDDKHIYWTRGSRQPLPTTTRFHQAAPSAEVEMTSYALMAYLHFLPDEAEKIAMWLSHQRNSLGGFASTQDTVVALDALSQFAALTYPRDPVDLKVKVTFTSKDAPSSIEFDVTEGETNNKLLLQSEPIPALPSTLHIATSGTGCALVQVSQKETYWVGKWQFNEANPLTPVSHVPYPNSGLSSSIFYLLPPITQLLPLTSHHPSPVYYLPPSVSSQPRPASYTSNSTSGVPYPTSHIPFPTPYILPLAHFLLPPVSRLPLFTSHFWPTMSLSNIPPPTYYVPFPAYYLPSPISHLPRATFGLLSPISNVPPATYNLRPTISHLQYPTCHVPPAAYHLPSPISHLPRATCGLPSSISNIPPATCHLRPIFLHFPYIGIASHFPLHTSGLLSITSLLCPTHRFFSSRLNCAAANVRYNKPAKAYWKGEKPNFTLKIYVMPYRYHRHKCHYRTLYLKIKSRRGNFVSHGMGLVTLRMVTSWSPAPSSLAMLENIYPKAGIKRVDYEKEEGLLHLYFEEFGKIPKRFSVDVVQDLDLKVSRPKSAYVQVVEYYETGVTTAQKYRIRTTCGPNAKKPFLTKLGYPAPKGTDHPTLSEGTCPYCMNTRGRIPTNFRAATSTIISTSTTSFITSSSTTTKINIDIHTTIATPQRSPYQYHQHHRHHHNVHLIFDTINTHSVGTIKTKKHANSTTATSRTTLHNSTTTTFFINATANVTTNTTSYSIICTTINTKTINATNTATNAAATTSTIISQPSVPSPPQQHLHYHNHYNNYQYYHHNQNLSLITVTTPTDTKLLLPQTKQPTPIQ